MATQSTYPTGGVGNKTLLKHITNRPLIENCADDYK